MGLRWIFNCATWTPTKEQFAIALKTVQDEERKRICSFVYKKDVKTALIGRLMIRKAVRVTTGLENHQVQLARTPHGRPHLINPNKEAALKTFIDCSLNKDNESKSIKLNTIINHNLSNTFNNTSSNNEYNANVKNKNNIVNKDNDDDNTNNISNIPPTFDFNISHDAELVVLASEPTMVGVDVMELTRPVGSGSVERFFRLMHRQFHINEWSYIHAGTSEHDQLQRFYRLWCMKESFVKALGVGVGFSLDRVQCCVSQEHHPGEGVEGSLASSLVTSSRVKVDGSVDEDYSFEEHLLFGRFLACVAVKRDDETPAVTSIKDFSRLSFEDLVEPLCHTPETLRQFHNDFLQFLSKPSSPTIHCNNH